MISTSEEVKQLKQTQPERGANKGAMNLAASWYVVMHSKDLGDKPKAIELFGQPLVAWRDDKSHPVIMEPYCSHMGSSLVIGKVVDGCIQCPFHHWRYDSSGQCVSIPEVDHIPPVARQATYVTAERYGYIWVWYGSQTPLFPLPEFSPAEDERHNYMPTRSVIIANTTLRQVMENIFDYSHIFTVHNVKFFGSVQITLLDEQHSVQQSELPIQKAAWFGAFFEFPLIKREDKIGAIGRIFGLGNEVLTVRIDAWPSGIIFTYSINGEERNKDLFCLTPVTENKTNLVSWFMVKKTGKFWIDIPSHAFFSWRNQAGFKQDLQIWSKMKPDMGKIYVKHDWLVLKFRKFYQSWVEKVE